eukprot:2244151-Lingulodinium_polyedra.AAC.1
MAVLELLASSKDGLTGGAAPGSTAASRPSGKSPGTETSLQQPPALLGQGSIGTSGNIAPPAVPGNEEGLDQLLSLASTGGL